MLSEHASAQRQTHTEQPPVPTLGFEPAQGGQSYGLEEVRGREIRRSSEVRLMLLPFQLAQRDPPFSLGRVQVSRMHDTEAWKQYSHQRGLSEPWFSL